jgi:hypothetical protein
MDLKELKELKEAHDDAEALLESLTERWEAGEDNEELRVAIDHTTELVTALWYDWLRALNN